MSNWRLILIGLALLVGGAVFAAIAVNQRNEDQRLAAEGDTVQGNVVSTSQSRRRRGGKSYKVDVAYVSTDGRVRHEKEFKVSSSEHARAEEQGTIPVTFLPSDPAVARIGGPRNTGLGLGVGAVMILAGGGVLAWFAKRLRTSSAPTVATVGGPSPPYPGGLPPIPPGPQSSGPQSAPPGVPAIPPVPPGATGGPPPPYSLPPR